MTIVTNETTMTIVKFHYARIEMLEFGRHALRAKVAAPSGSSFAASAMFAREHFTLLATVAASSGFDALPSKPPLARVFFRRYVVSRGANVFDIVTPAHVLDGTFLSSSRVREDAFRLVNLEAFV